MKIYMKKFIKHFVLCFLNSNRGTFRLAYKMISSILIMKILSISKNKLHKKTCRNYISICGMLAYKWFLAFWSWNFSVSVIKKKKKKLYCIFSLCILSVYLYNSYIYAINTANINKTTELKNWEISCVKLSKDAQILHWA